MREKVAGASMSSRPPGRVPRQGGPYGIRRPAGRERRLHASHVALPAPATERFSVDWEMPGQSRADR